MRRGTRVGSAYIAVTADGSNIDDDLTREFDSVDYQKLGNKGGREYREAMLASVRGVVKDLEGDFLPRIDQVIINEESIGREVTTELSKVFKSGKLQNLFDYVGREAGYKFGGAFDEVARKEILNVLEKGMMESARAGDKDFLKRLLVDNENGFSVFGSLIDQASHKVETAVKKASDAQIAADKKVADARQAQRTEYFKLSMKVIASELKEGLDAQATLAKDKETRQTAYFKVVMKNVAAELREGLNAQAALSKAELKAEKERKAQKTAYFKLVMKNVAAELREGLNAQATLEKEATKSLETRHQLAMKQMAAEIAEGIKARKDEDKADKALWDARNMRARVHAKLLADIAKGRDMGQFGSEGQYRPLGYDIDEVYKQQRKFSSALGGMFGMGSRNNALNLLGSSINNVLGLTFGLTRGVKIMSAAFQQGFTSAGANANFLQKSMAGLVAVGARVGPTLVMGLKGLAIALPIVIALTSVLASVMSALFATVTALASTIVVSLVGGLTILGGTLGVVAAAAGLLAVAFTSMTDEQKKAMGVSFRPLKEDLTGLGQVVLNDLIPAFDTWSRNLRSAVAMAVPAASQMGAAFGQAGSIITASLTGPGFQRFAEMMAVYLPGIVTNLSRALGGFLNGLFGLFAGLTPAVSRFATYLANVATKFGEWAGSAEGQNSIMEFAEDAEDALRSLWNFTREFFGMIKDVLYSDAAQDSGNSMFDDMADSIKRFRETITEENLEKWFDDARKFIDSAAEAVRGFSDVMMALSNSGVLAATGSALSFLGKAMEFLAVPLGWIVNLFGFIAPGALAMLGPLGLVAQAAGVIGDSFTGMGGSIEDAVNAAIGAINRLIEKINLIPLIDIPTIDPVSFSDNKSGKAKTPKADPNIAKALAAAGLSGAGAGITAANATPKRPTPRKDISNLIWEDPNLGALGRDALANTSQKNGGDRPDYVNPYVAWAEGLMSKEDSAGMQVRKALRSMSKKVSEVLREGAAMIDGGQVRDAFKNLYSDLRANGANLVDTAQQGLNSAAQTLANANSPEAAKKALKAVKRAQKDLAQAEKAQRRINKVAARINNQSFIWEPNVDKMVAGQKVKNATLAEIAAARGVIAEKLAAAEQQLEAALSQHKSSYESIRDNANAFGSILGAQAKIIDGVEQALTARDVTDHLQSRLNDLTKFHRNLQSLLSMGLSEAAYKQIVEAGAQDGGAYAQALVDGGAGSVQQVNNLVGQIGGIADRLGSEAADKMFQAGIETARGIVKGLESQDKQLEAAATKLGEKIAKAVRKSLGINSPSQVMIDDMDFVGDGVSIGLDNQSRKVEDAAAALAAMIHLTPSQAEAEYTARAMGQGNVSGNGDEHHWHINTPTEDPKGVAQEMMNEMAGRL